jgi:hypothetical protein
MFGWLRPRCPLSTAEKVWMESRMMWLAERLGANRLRESAVIEPTDEFFPEAYQAQDDDAQRVFRQVCQWMRIDPYRVRCELYDRIPCDEPRDPLGLYIQGNPARILIGRSQLTDPESLVGTIAHELAHEILLGGGHLQDNNEDLERLTDVTTVFCGLGIFCANSALRETTVREGRFSWWSLQKQGYLPLRMFGYGMSLFAWARGEQNPPWLRYLRLDARENMARGLQYLWKTGDSVFQIKPPSASPGDDAAEHGADRLAHASRSYRLLGLFELLDEGSAPAHAVDSIARLLNDDDPDISSTAAHLLGIIGEPALNYAPRLLDLLSSRAPANRERAAFALGELRPNDVLVCRELGSLLNDDRLEVCQAAAEALEKFGPAAGVALMQLLARFEKSLIKCDACIDALAAALTRICPDAHERVREHFSEIDAELCNYAEQCLLQARDSDCVT